MTTKYERITEAVERKHPVEKTCDWCGKITERNIGNHHEWAEDSNFDVEHVTIEYRTGQVFPEGGSYTIYSYDICPDCFEERLMPFFASENISLQEEDIDV